MEDRRPVYHNRNTVNKPRVTKKMRDQIHQPLTIGQMRERTLIIPKDRQKKTMAALRCHWCNHEAEKYFVVCHRCKHCLYCGLRCSGNSCQFCNNRLPDSENIKPIRKVIKIV